MLSSAKHFCVQLLSYNRTCNNNQGSRKCCIGEKPRHAGVLDWRAGTHGIPRNRQQEAHRGNRQGLAMVLCYSRRARQNYPLLFLVFRTAMVRSDAAGAAGTGNEKDNEHCATRLTHESV